MYVLLFGNNPVSVSCVLICLCTLLRLSLFLFFCLNFTPLIAHVVRCFDMGWSISRSSRSYLE